MLEMLAELSAREWLRFTHGVEDHQGGSATSEDVMVMIRRENRGDVLLVHESMYRGLKQNWQKDC